MLLGQISRKTSRRVASLRLIVARRSTASLCSRRKRAKGREKIFTCSSLFIFLLAEEETQLSTLVRQRACLSAHESRDVKLVGPHADTTDATRRDLPSCRVYTKPVASYAAFIARRLCAAFESPKAAERRRSWTSGRRRDCPIGSPAAPRRAHWPV